MKIQPIHYVQIALACIVAGATATASAFPALSSLALAMHLTVTVVSGVLTALSLYAPPPNPGTVVGPTGIQTVHTIQMVIGSTVSSMGLVASASAQMATVANIVSGVGMVLLAILSVISPQALETKGMRANRMARVLADRHEQGEET